MHCCCARERSSRGDSNQYCQATCWDLVWPQLAGGLLLSLVWTNWSQVGPHYMTKPFAGCKPLILLVAIPHSKQSQALWKWRVMIRYDTWLFQSKAWQLQLSSHRPCGIEGMCSQQARRWNAKGRSRTLWCGEGALPILPAIKLHEFVSEGGLPHIIIIILPLKIAV